ncbi:alpha/beta hydrolase [Amycolatopsis minnesotensis]|uniref:Alpha/beta hydrolase n=1 Tax=Amycolatopsis minnesotensis TaxID=337894 RepID=A0ABN2SFK5_9PSEU
MRASTEDREVRRPDDTTIRYTASGPADGPVLALIHGWGCDRHDFDAITGFLPPHLRVLAIDLAEHGDSRSAREVWTIEEFARDVAAVLAAESVGSCVVAGHSLGGAVAIETARQLPDTVTRVVTLEAVHYLSLFPAQDEAQAEAVLLPFREDFAGAMRGMVEAGSPPGTDPALVDAYTKRMGAVRQPAGLRSLEGMLRWDMDAALREVAQPHVLFAVRTIITQEAIDRYGDRMRIELVDLGSHHFPAESPEATAGLLAAVMSE